MTGAPLPAGADAVCMLEDSADEDGGSVVVIDHPVAVGEAVRPAGEDVAVGDVVADPGTVVTPAHIGVFANLGIAAVTAHPRPRVGVLSTGDEVATAAGPAGAGPDPRCQSPCPSGPGRWRGLGSGGSRGCRRRRGRAGSGLRPCRRGLRCPRDQWRGERGGPRHREGGPREAVPGDDVVDADRHPTGEAVRVRDARRIRFAGLRPARQSRLGHGQLRAVGPAGSPADGRPSRHSSTPWCGPSQPTRSGAGCRREDPLRQGLGLAGGARHLAGATRWPDRTRTTCWPWPTPTPWPCYPTARGSRPVGSST